MDNFYVSRNFLYIRRRRACLFVRFYTWPTQTIINFTSYLFDYLVFFLYSILISFVFIGHETMLAVTSLESQNQFFPSVILREQSDSSRTPRYFPVL